MALFEALHSQRYRIHLCWNDLKEALMLGPKTVQEVIERIKVIQRNVKAAQDRQKSYVNQRQKPLEF